MDVWRNGTWVGPDHDFYEVPLTCLPALLVGRCVQACEVLDEDTVLLTLDNGRVYALSVDVFNDSLVLEVLTMDEPPEER